ncbi:hypothetical protein IQE94_13175 [Synechocystis sp. PCC 7339]|uniref:hypothetical protein n=1 Tax=Synechocystis sp. PCC 7339 TaxID=2782213 RepID=UPI001CC09B2F|nr:hypothetical protein [Synechocystis sp. PCC 7339]UAJ72049.1 hypothetical protein IQE94_13175 [Synechocystis sp. PCC 7339]
MNKTKLLLTACLLIGCSKSTQAETFSLDLIPVEEYQQQLNERESEGGQLFCKNSPNEKIQFNNCSKFQQLRSQGCYGATTYEIAVEINYVDVCAQIDLMKKAHSFDQQYFQLDSPHWWKQLPAQIIPMRGGIYSEESWENETRKPSQLTKDKLLEELEFQKIAVDNQSVELILSATAADCGVINDTFTLSAILLSDFDQDGIAELLIKGDRRNVSQDCQLGTGNIIGGSSTIVLKKSGADENISVIATL